MVINCDIKFDENPFQTYFSGQIVSGKVEISSDKPKKIRGIALKISGLAKTNWAESGGNKEKTAIVKYTGREDYLSTLTYLIGSEDGNTIDILPGMHMYTFACALPINAPSSFEGPFGHIRYQVKVVLERPLKIDQTYTVGFTVLKEVDLNYDSPILRMPFHSNVIKEFWCVMCCSSPLTIDVRIDQIGYVPGQIIVIKANINNASNVNVKNVEFTLRRIVSYRSQMPNENTKIDTTHIANKLAGSIDKGTLKRIEGHIQIPAIPPTNNYICKLIQISYDVKISAKLSGIHKKPFVTCPITIGTRPLVNVIQQQPIRNQFNIIEEYAEDARRSSEIEMHIRKDEYPPRRNTLPLIAPIINPANTLKNSEIPPPSYEEALQTRTCLSEEGEICIRHTDFVPRYPVYNFNAPMPSAPVE